jgi:hypothetical protein
LKPSSPLSTPWISTSNPGKRSSSFCIWCWCRLHAMHMHKHTRTWDMSIRDQHILKVRLLNP